MNCLTEHGIRLILSRTQAILILGRKKNPIPINMPLSPVIPCQTKYLLSLILFMFQNAINECTVLLAFIYSCCSEKDGLCG